MNNEQLKEKIRMAEEAVTGMQDPNLKKAAFETILSRLLGDAQATKSASPKNTAVKRRKTPSRGGKQTKSSQEKKSSINLGVDQLKELKTFYDQHAPDGTENAVFTLAYYLHEKLKQETFHEGDILRVYQNLLPLKPTKRPPAMSLEEIRRAMRWLVAPSRNKQWLKADADGMYQITPQGMLHLSYGSKTKK